MREISGPQTFSIPRPLSLSNLLLLLILTGFSQAEGSRGRGRRYSERQSRAIWSRHWGDGNTRRTNAFHHCFLDAATCTAQEHPCGCSPQLCPALAPPWCLQKWDCFTSSPSSLPSQPPLFLIPSSSKNHNLNFPPTWTLPQWLPFQEIRKVMLRFNF